MKVQTDKLMGYDKAILPDSVLALYRFHDGPTVYIGRADERAGSLRRVTNEKYAYADSFAAFKRLAADFVRDAG